MATSPHRIRLHGPWDLLPGVPGFNPRRATIPQTLRAAGLNGFAGQIRYHRSFGRPTNLGADDRVWIVFEEISGPAEIRLNGEMLGAGASPARFEVKALLRLRNDLVIDMTASDDSAGITGEVVLEIAR